MDCLDFMNIDWSAGVGITQFLKRAVKLPIIIVDEITKHSTEDTITFLFTKWVSSKFSTSPKAMHPLINAA